MNRDFGKRLARSAIAWQICSKPSPKFSRRWPVISTMSAGGVAQPSSHGSPGIGGQSCFTFCTATCSASITVLPVTRTDSARRPP